MGWGQKAALSRTFNYQGLDGIDRAGAVRIDCSTVIGWELVVRILDGSHFCSRRVDRSTGKRTRSAFEYGNKWACEPTETGGDGAWSYMQGKSQDRRPG